MTGRPGEIVSAFSPRLRPSVGAILMTNRVRKRENIFTGPFECVPNIVLNEEKTSGK